MFDKLIVLYTANYNLKADYFFGISYLLSHGVKVEFWNLSELLLHEKYPQIDSPKGLIERTICDNDEFNDFIRQNREALYTTPIGFNKVTYTICKILSKYKVCVLYGNFGMIPYKGSVVGHDSHNSIIWPEIIAKIKFRNINWLFRKILFKTSFFKPAAYVLKSSKLVEDFYKTDNSTIVLKGSSSDYINYKMAEGKANVEHPYIVFIDQNIAYHPEGGTLVEDVCTDPQGYFDRMNALFETLERLYSCEVIICAHPTSVFLQDNNPFNGRRIEFGKTQEFVRGSIGVVSHNSTALSFAVLCEKPILLVTTNDIENNMRYGAHIISNFRDLLGCSYVNLDDLNVNNYSDFNRYDKEKYSEYIENYLSLNEEKSNGKVILELFQ